MKFNVNFLQRALFCILYECFRILTQLKYIFLIIFIIFYLFFLYKNYYLLSILIEENMQRQLIPTKQSDEKSKSYQLQIKTKTSMFKKRLVKTWTFQQDQRLIQLHKRYPKKWNIISQQMKNRNQNQCLHRYRRICQIGQNKKIWSPYEDEIVLKMINKIGYNWKIIAQQLKTKTGKQIRQRFINKLDPKIRRQQWTEEQDLKIIQLFSKWGSKWCQISKCLSGRPQNRIKNRFYSYIQKNYQFGIKLKSMQSQQMKQKNLQKVESQKQQEQQNKQNSPLIAAYRPITKKQSQSSSLSKKSSMSLKILQQKKGSVNLSLVTQQPLMASKQSIFYESNSKKLFCQQRQSCYQQYNSRQISQQFQAQQQQCFQQIINEQKIFFNQDGSLKQINDECYYKNYCSNENGNNDLLYFQDNQ